MTPEIFGKYLLLDRLAAGGMGEVFLAKAGPRGFERYFAIKRILAQHSASTEFIQMLINEAKITISLIHPNIAQVFEFGQIERDFFLAMEYIEGPSLAAVLNSCVKSGQRLKIADAVSIIRQTCQALDYAHDKCDTMGSPLGIIHRDVSPQNVLIDRNGTAKLIDFGVAKAATSRNLTADGSIKGKIAYMSPEQARGEALDRRSDIFAAGILLYEALTDRNAFPSGDNVMDLLVRVQTGNVTPVETVVPGLPESLYAVVRRALAPKKEDRYSYAREMDRDLARVLNEIDPAYTAHELGQTIRSLDLDGGARTGRFHVYTDLHPEDFVSAAKTRRARASSPGSGTQASDLDLEIDVSDDVDEEPRGPRRIPRAYLALGVFAVCVLLAGIGVFFWQSGMLIRTGGASSSANPDWSAPAANEPAGTLKLTSSPAGATISINSHLTGVLTPASLRVPADKDLLVRIELKGYATKVVAVRLHAGESQNLPATLTTDGTGTGVPAGTAPGAKETGTVTLDSDPPTEVYVDQERIGHTPIIGYRAPAGKLTVKFTQPALGLYRQITIDVPANGQTSERVMFKKGRVNLDIRPWADVYIGKRKLGTTPMAPLELYEGTYTLRLVNPELGAVRMVEATVRAGKTVSIVERLE